MRRYRAQLIAIMAALLLAGLPASVRAEDVDKPADSKTTDTSKVDAAKKQVETGAKQAGEGIKETAKGIGNRGGERTKGDGEKTKAAGREREPGASQARA